VRVVAAGDALLAPSGTRRLIADVARRTRASPPSRAKLGALVPRETDVAAADRARHVQRRYQTLAIAEQTAKTLRPMLAKLKLLHRVRRPVVLAYESGLVAPGAQQQAGRTPLWARC
jgi:hypothetical protein